MEQMSTAALEELLLQDFRDPGRDADDMDGLYQAAQVLAEREPGAPDAADRAWEAFREGWLPFAEALGEDGGTPSSDAAPERRHPAFRRRIRMALAATAAAVLLCVSVAVTANDRDLGDLRALWTDERIWLTPGQIVPAGRDEIHMPEEPGEYASIQEALAACGLTGPIMPSQLPEGFEMEELIVDEFGADELIVDALYSRDEEHLVMQVDIYLDREDTNGDRHGNFQKDAGDPVPYEAGGIVHLLTTNAGRSSALWANGPAECSVSGDITMEELERMLDSIYQ